jgi:hypothetical protein
MAKAMGREPRVYQHIDYPLNAGGSLIITSYEDPDGINGVKAWRFDLEAAQRGLQLMAEKYPHHYADFMAENDDATTGDVFLQLCSVRGSDLRMNNAAG